MTHNQDNWEMLLLMIKFAYNNLLHTSIKQSSFYVNYSYHSYIIFNTDYNVMSVSMKNLVKNLNHIHQKLYINLEKAFKLQAKYYNKCHIYKSYKVDNYIYLDMRNFKTRRSNKKLDFKINSLFQIIEIIDKQTY